MVGVRFSTGALEDLENISSYISKDSPKRAKNFVKEIFKKIEQLKDFPYMGRKFPDKNEETLREFFHKDYRIVYEIGKEFIEILIVVHGSRIVRF
ncbi:MAG: type II toxin-antitoxin system RelE/ParE family toxin [Candidatus Lokiarchaeota archaeon]|nr:type II toxin-antitoxin system RelE/ParE family toxin [Candidatus Lokiarchaeota archaeon]